MTSISPNPMFGSPANDNATSPKIGSKPSQAGHPSKYKYLNTI